MIDNFKEWLRGMMNRHGLSIADVSSITGYQRSSIGYWLHKNERRPQYHTESTMQEKMTDANIKKWMKKHTPHGRKA